MERIDIAGCLRAQANMVAALEWDPRHALAQIDPEFGIGLAESDRDQPRQAERRARCLIEARGSFEVADADGDVIYATT